MVTVYIISLGQVEVLTCVLAFLGLMSMVTGSVSTIVAVAVPNFVGSPLEIAVIVTVAGLGMVAGAV
jgi:hypothetical protein